MKHEGVVASNHDLHYYLRVCCSLLVVGFGCRVYLSVVAVCYLVVGRPFGCQVLTIDCRMLLSVVVVCYLVVGCRCCQALTIDCRMLLSVVVVCCC
jgi:hypothetical protein